MRSFLLLIALLITADFSRAEVEVSAWSRATPPSATTAAIYGRFTNKGDQAMSVARVQAAFAEHAMIHETQHRNGMATMRHGSLSIPPAGHVELRPGGMHIMLMGMNRELLTGCYYEFSLIWTDGSTSRHKFLTGGLGQLSPPEPTTAESCL